jgi:hypothetical protein
MDTTYEPYRTQYPGDLITAEESNELQIMIKEDIAAQTQEAIDGIERVPAADNADKLENTTLDDLKQQILNEVLSTIPERTGYQKLFKILEMGEENVVEHGLMACPLVDIYQLDYFQVVASEDGYKFVTWVNFYLYHSSEKRLRYRDETVPGADFQNIAIEPPDGHPYRIPLKDMLAYYNVDYTNDSSLVDLETEFWQKFSADPNDDFDDDQHAHSPYFDRCCREERTVQSLKDKRDWDDLWFQMRPRKTINYPYVGGNPLPIAGATTYGDPVAPDQNIDPRETVLAPTQIEVAHFDFNTLGLKLLREPVLPFEWFEADGIEPDRHDQVANELKVMVLLKV